MHRAPAGNEVLDARFVLAQLLAAENRVDEARTELTTLRPAFRGRYGSGSLHLRNLDRQIDRLGRG